MRREINSKNRLYFGMIFVLLFILGYWIAFVYPAKIAEKEFQATVATYNDFVNKSQRLKTRIDNEKWLNQEIISEIKKNFQKSQELLLEVKAKIKNADSLEHKEKKIISESAKSLLEGKEGANFFLNEVEDKFSSANKIAEEVKKRVKIIHEEIDAENKALSEWKDKLNMVSHKFLSVYVSGMDNLLVQTEENMQKATQIFANAEKLVPPIDYNTFSADPFKAAEMVATGVEAFIGGKNYLSDFSKEFSFQSKALSEAYPTTASAKEKEKIVEEKFETTINETKLSLSKGLKSARTKFSEAQNLIKISQHALKTKVEGDKVDLPLAYKNSLSAISILDEAASEIDQQVKFMDEAAKKIKQAKSILAIAEKKFRVALEYQDDLRSLHHRDVVNKINKSFEVLKQHLFDSAKNLSEAEKMYSDEQDFKSAQAKVKKGDESLKLSNTLIEEIQNQQTQLENARISWSKVKRRAKDIIDDESSNVSEYGSYSLSAQSDFEDAVDLLARAISYASIRKYKEAVDCAEKAYLHAEGTGHRALSAYEDYLEEQRREEQRQREEEEESSQPSFGFGGGMSDDDSGGGFFSGGSSDGGIFDSGPSDSRIFDSSPSDGGGY